MTKIRSFFARMGMVAAAALVLGGGVAQAQSCDATALKGSFVFQMRGITYEQSYYGTTTYQLTTVGQVTSDGEGNLTGKDTFNYDGTLARRTVTGTYTVNEDCTGSVTITGDFKYGSETYKLEFNADFYMLSADEFELTTIDGGFVMTGTLKRQSLPKVPATTNTESVKK